MFKIVWNMIWTSGFHCNGYSNNVTYFMRAWRHLWTSQYKNYEKITAIQPSFQKVSFWASNKEMIQKCRKFRFIQQMPFRKKAFWQNFWIFSRQVFPLLFFQTFFSTLLTPRKNCKIRKALRQERQWIIVIQWGSSIKAN